jgi:hypothetical protein
MGKRSKAWWHWIGLGMLSASVAGCGGEIVGIGNGGNRIGQGATEEVAEALAKHPGTPRVTDAELTRIFAAIFERATDGDPEAALIVLRVAEEQREADED